MCLVPGILDPNITHEFRGTLFMSTNVNKEDKTKLLLRATSGDARAKLKLVKAYLGLVAEIAANYAPESKAQFSEILQLGALTLLKAIDSFNDSQSVDFSDHARQEITKALEGMFFKI